MVPYMDTSFLSDFMNEIALRRDLRSLNLICVHYYTTLRGNNYIQYLELYFPLNYIFICI